MSRENRQIRHFVSIDGQSKKVLEHILATAKHMLGADGTPRSLPLLRGYTCMNLFFENSTRTRTNFELAAKALAANVINMDIRVSSVSKGETLSDTVQTLQAMHPRLLVIRHNQSGAAKHIADLIDSVSGPPCAVINAGDGSYEHPTQAMLDMFTIAEHTNDFASLRIAIVGDIIHSRVARSQIRALQILGTKDIRLVTPPNLADGLEKAFSLPVYTNCDKAIEGCDIISLLRIQHERIEDGVMPNPTAYFRDYGITSKRLALAKPKAIIMHPGPINRGVEIANEVADSSQSVILDQVRNGIAVRMAIMAMLAGARQD